MFYCNYIFFLLVCESLFDDYAERFLRIRISFRTKMFEFEKRLLRI